MTIKKFGFLILFSFFSVIVFAADPGAKTSNEVAAEMVSVKTPKVEAVAVGDSATQVFMELDNHGQRYHDLVAAYSPAAKQTQLHQTVQIGGKSQMRQVSYIGIQPKHVRDLQQGGFHVMLMGIDKPLTKGQNLPIVLIFEDGSSITIHAPVV